MKDEIKKLLIDISFNEAIHKPNLFYQKLEPKDANNIVGVTAFVDCIKNEKGRRYYTVEGDNTVYSKPEEVDKIPVLLYFKQERDKLLGLIETEKGINLPKQGENPTGAKFNRTPAIVEGGQQKQPDLFKKGKTYKVSGKDTPDAARTQQESNDRGISTRIVFSEQDSNHAKAVVQACFLDTGQYAESVVNHDYALMKEVILMDLIKDAASNNKKIIESHDSDGRPVLVPEYQQRLYERFIRAKYFALRDAETKATRRAQLKLLNRDWREQDERDSEMSEKALVEGK